jgi:hypothetical protein
MNPSDPPLNFGHEPDPVSYPAGSVIDFAQLRLLSANTLDMPKKTTA